MTGSNREGNCGAIGPSTVAARSPSQAATGTGGQNRSQVAYGTPRKTTTPTSSWPRSRPLVVSAVVFTTVSPYPY
jgi:hypothetical protein